MSKRRYSDPGEALIQRKYVSPVLGMDVRMMDAPAGDVVMLNRRSTGPRRFVPYAKTYKPRRFYGRRGPMRVFRPLHIEKKNFDTAVNFAVDNTGEVPATGQLNLIPQDVTQTGRIGRSVQVKSIQMRGEFVYTPGASAVGGVTVYCLLVQDRQCNGAAAAITDVMTSNNLQVALVNMANSKRFRILRRWTYTLQAAAGVSTAFATDRKQLDDYLKCNIPLEFLAGNAITDVKSNNLFLLASTDGAEDDLVTFSGTCRLRFTDI